MERTVTASAYIACPFSMALEYATDYLQYAEDGLEEAEIRVPVRFFPTMHRSVRLTFSIHSDALEAGRAHDEIRIRWMSSSALLPEFHGAVRFRIAGAGTTVHVCGTYRTPFGIAGRVFDEFVGLHIANASVRDLSTRIGAFVAARQAEWLAGHIRMTG
jgi:hypothetical protein